MVANTRRTITAALLALVAAALLAGTAVSDADAQGLTWQQLQDAGWTCFAAPVGPPRVVCFDPGVGRPFPGNPDPAPSYNGLLFSPTSGELLYGVHFIRADLYHGQRCGTEPYAFAAGIGYYECGRD
jgi:hypothetical protein